MPLPAVRVRGAARRIHYGDDRRGRVLLAGLKRWLVVLTALAVAATRIWARSRTLWDWDETLFALGVRSYDVTQHHPHPPGFPLYVALGKLFRLFAHSDFHALQAINVLAAIALFPLLLWLALELRFEFRTAYLGALLCVFFPNVWFFGGTAFSDIPGLALTIAACATLLRGAQSTRAYFLGALLLGLAAAIRPQALLIGCAPALYASWIRKRPKDLLVASAIGLAVLTIAYGGAALASDSVAGYFEAERNLREYVHHVDSFLNPARPPLPSLFGDFFLHAIPGGRITIVISALALISVLSSVWRRHSCLRTSLLLAMFLPFNIVGWFMLDTNSISRYAIGFSPMYAILAADAIAPLTVVVQAMAVIAAIARFWWWTAPAIHEVRKTVSPPVAAMQWVRGNVPKSRPLYVHGSMAPFADYFLADYAVRDRIAFGANDWYITEGSTADLDGRNFIRARGNLASIARDRYFEVSAAPVTSLWRFGSGWYLRESTGIDVWRWMGGRSETFLPPLGGPARLTLTFDFPTELVPRRPAVDIFLNGQHVDHVVGTTLSVTRSLTVASRGDGWNQLVITVDKVLNPAKEHILPDTRDLGLELKEYGWAPTAR